VLISAAALSRIPSRSHSNALWNNKNSPSSSNLYNTFAMTTKSISSNSNATSGVHKRRRRATNDDGAHAHVATSDSPPPVPAQKPSPPTTSGAGGGSSSFRNVSACNRCRLRKNRCDQRLPACLSCEKAGVKCVGYDPITKREIPRRWVVFL
jgi:hypothetical protein